MVRLLVRATTRHPIVTILIVSAIAVLALIPASNFSVESGMDTFLSTDDPDVVMAEHVKEKFGEQDLVTADMIRLSLLPRRDYLLARFAASDCR